MFTEVVTCGVVVVEPGPVLEYPPPHAAARRSEARKIGVRIDFSWKE
jgi:hypothetical protein